MTKFIDTDAGRQLLKDYFSNPAENYLYDPNYLEYADQWACFPILGHITQLYECFKNKTHMFGRERISFSEGVHRYLGDNDQRIFTTGTVNFEEHFQRYYGAGPTDDDYYDEPETFRNTVEYSSGDEWAHTEEYLDSLKSLVS